ncbi:MAG TPA: hypothetical protein V6D25_06705 [Leptolyngbyaceae cyanobacterium]
MLTIGLGIEFPVRAGTNQISQNSQYTGQQRRQLNQPSTSQQLWQRFRQQQDQFRLQQQQRLEQFRLQDQIRQQQSVPFGMEQLRQQQRQEMDTLRLQQQLQSN